MIIDKDRIQLVPTDPGVYFFKDKSDHIIYIGKAKNLRNRVRSYFQKSKHQSAKNISMIKRIVDIEWLVVRSEVEALLTEANLIKKHQPHYNINLKDDKSFPFIRITKEPYPRVFITREIKKDGSKYFGPFTDVIYLRRMLKAIRKIFPVRSCDYYIDKTFISSKKIKVCLDYHIKKCQGPCEGLVTEHEYGNMINHIISFLHGKTNDAEVYIRSQMLNASVELNYEDAGIFRDQLHAIREFKKHQRKVASDFEDRDVVALARDGDYAVAVIVRIRNGRITSREKLSIKNIDELESTMMQTIITRFYLESDFIPKEITLQVYPDSKLKLLEWLKEKRSGSVKFILPQKGEKAKELRLAFQNAKLLLGEWMINRKKRHELIPKKVDRLMDDLQLKVPPKRIEAFDVSHLGGTDTVASMVCFVNGKPKKSEYRKYNIKDVIGIDDFASIREVVSRRYRRVKSEGIGLPDLILIDGGKGQLSMAVSALRELGLDYLPVIGLAKRLEEVFIPGSSDPQSIHKQSPGLFLLREIRDEAHRFAINFQKHKRTKKISKSLFEDINGVGPKSVKILLNKFKDIRKISDLKPEQLHKELNFSYQISEQIISVAKKARG